MTQDEITKWEKKNRHNITGWDADYATKPGYKIITFFINGGQRIVEIKISS
jgi:hypothetical protein